MPGDTSGRGWIGRFWREPPPTAPDLAALLDALPVSVLAYHPRRGVLYVNQTLAKRLSRPASELVGLTAEDLLPEHVAAYVRSHEDEALAGGLFSCEVTHSLHESAEERTALLTMSACAIEGWGDVLAVLVRDVTGERQTELELARQRDFVQALFDSTDILLAVVDESGRIVRWNQAFERMTGFHISEVAGRPFQSALLTPQCRARGESLLRRVASTGLPQRERLEIAGRNSEIFHVAWSAAPLEADSQFAVLTGVDETQAVRAKRQQAEIENELRAVWESVADFMMFLDASGVIIAANGALCVLAGMDRSSLEGRVFLEVFQQWPGHESDELDQFRRRFETRSMPQREVAEYKICTGKTVWLEITSTFVERPGEPVLLLQIARDITDRVEREQQLRETNEFLESATQWAKEMAASAEMASAAKSEFLANVSHEIRTPMNGILGMTELALMTGLTGEQREYLRIVQSSAESLLTLLDDILDLSKAEAGRIELKPEPFNLRVEVENLTKQIAHRAAAKLLSFEYRLGEDLPEFLTGDWSRLRQVLLNLLSNSIKFTDEGGIQLQVDCLGYVQGLARVRFLVSDSGIGMPPRKIGAAFEPFTQLENSSTRRRGGTGLGLPICAKLVDLMGGWLVASGSESNGMVFGFVLALPLASEDSATSQALSQPALIPFDRPVRCLLAEDNPVNQKLFTAMLERAGIQVSLAKTGSEAVELALKERFDVAIMDVQMPEMDGLEAAAAIRSNERVTGGHLPIIAITAHAMPGDRDMCFAAGMDRYLSKPVRMRTLLGEIQHLLATRSAKMNKDAPDATPSYPMIDYPQALDRVGGDRDLLAELAGLFLEEYPRLLAEISEGVQTGDLAMAAGAAHQLKGLLAQFGSEKGRLLALEVETASKSGDASESKVATEKLSSHLSELHEVLVRLSRGEDIV